MKIHWANIFAFLFGLVAFVLVLKHGRLIVNSLLQIGPGHSPGDQTVGILALCLICVSIVAVVRLLTRK